MAMLVLLLLGTVSISSAICLVSLALLGCFKSKKASAPKKLPKPKPPAKDSKKEESKDPPAKSEGEKKTEKSEGDKKSEKKEKKEKSEKKEKKGKEAVGEKKTANTTQPTESEPKKSEGSDEMVSKQSILGTPPPALADSPIVHMKNGSVQSDKTKAPNQEVDAKVPEPLPDDATKPADDGGYENVDPDNNPLLSKLKQNNAKPVEPPAAAAGSSSPALPPPAKPAAAGDAKAPDDAAGYENVDPENNPLLKMASKQKQPSSKSARSGKPEAAAGHSRSQRENAAVSAADKAKEENDAAMIYNESKAAAGALGNVTTTALKGIWGAAGAVTGAVTGAAAGAVTGMGSTGTATATDKSQADGSVSQASVVATENQGVAGDKLKDGKETGTGTTDSVAGTTSTTALNKPPLKKAQKKGTTINSEVGGDSEHGESEGGESEGAGSDDKSVSQEKAKVKA